MRRKFDGSCKFCNVFALIETAVLLLFKNEGGEFVPWSSASVLDITAGNLWRSSGSSGGEFKGREMKFSEVAI